MTLTRHLLCSLLVAAMTVAAMAVPAHAHFGMIIPSNTTPGPKSKTISLQCLFAHPFTLVGMELVKPKAFYAVMDGTKIDLLGSLKQNKMLGHTAWTTDFTIKRPGVYALYMEPQPYWEPAEDLSIIHYTKTYVAAFGGEEGWDEPLGVKTEIVPMLRPFGNYAGMTFVGKVLREGKPVPGADVEVEYYNADNALGLPTDYHQTHVVKADDAGIFVATCPRAGWWGFAALTEGDFTVKDPDGKEKAVEMGAVLWTHFDDWKKR
ncbi:MAG: DUF4198 domain-containing protein [Desulfovibrionaceae bacterium]